MKVTLYLPEGECFTIGIKDTNTLMGLLSVLPEGTKWDTDWSKYIDEYGGSKVSKMRLSDQDYDLLLKKGWIREKVDQAEPWYDAQDDTYVLAWVTWAAFYLRNTTTSEYVTITRDYCLLPGVWRYDHGNDEWYED